MMYAPFVQSHLFNLYPVPRSAIAVGFSNNYPLDSLLSGGYSAIQRLDNQGRPVARFFLRGGAIQRGNRPNEAEGSSL